MFAPSQISYKRDHYRIKAKTELSRVCFSIEQIGFSSCTESCRRRGFNEHSRAEPLGGNGEKSRRHIIRSLNAISRK